MSLYLVTGNAGFIGSTMADILIDRGDEVIGVDGMFEGSHKNNINPFVKSQENYGLHWYDTEWIRVLESEYWIPDYIIHIAAASNVDTSIKAPQKFTANYEAMSNVLYFAQKHKIPTIACSTDETYGSYQVPESGSFAEWEYIYAGKGYDENQPLNPSNPYAASKAACDLLCLSYFKTYGTDVRITRAANNFGIRQQDKLIPMVIKKGLAGERIPIFRTPALRDWLHVEDHCMGMLAALEKGKAGEIYNITANNEKSPEEIVEILGFSHLIDKIEDRKGYDLRYFCNSDKLRKLGWIPTKKVENCKDELLNWYTKAYKYGYFE